MTVCKLDALRVGKALDRRRKLDDDDREHIRRLYHVDNLAIREIARMYAHKCTRRLIQFVLFPERLLTVNYAGHYKHYYDTDKRRAYMRDHREYKRKLKKEGKI